jgi:hypothetical protein
MVKTSNYDQEYLDANVEIYYPECVGVCYVPIYPNQFGNYPEWSPYQGGGIPPAYAPPEFSGTNSHGAIWLYYTPSDIELQVGNLKKLGFNCLRIWTNYFIWNMFENALGDWLPEGDNLMLTSLDHFLTHCDSVGMNVGVCLLEHYSVGTSNFIEPGTVGEPRLGGGGAYDYSIPAYIVDAWTQVPGTSRESSGFLASGLGGDYLAASSYIVDVINTCKDHACITTYDICNAANESLPDSVELFKQCADLIRATDPNMDHKVFLNSEGLTPFTGLALSNPISSYSSIDLVTTHPFFITRRAWNEYMNIAFSAAINYGKPFYGTECGFPGGFQRYEDMVEYSRNRNVGYTFWQAMCGHPKGNEAFGTGGGFLHYDGTIRDYPACKAVYDHARDLGYRVGDMSIPSDELGQEVYKDTDYDGEVYGPAGARRIADNYLPYPGNPVYQSTSGVAFRNWISERYGPDEAIAEILDWRNRTSFSGQDTATLAGDWYTRQYTLLNNFYLDIRTPFSDIFQQTTGTEWEIGILDFPIDAGRFGELSADYALSAMRDAIDTSGINQALDPVTGDPNNVLFIGGVEGIVDPANWAPYDELFNEWFWMYEQILEYLEWTDNST